MPIVEVVVAVPAVIVFVVGMIVGVVLARLVGVVVGGGIVVRLSRWVVVLVGVFELAVAVGVSVADSRHQSQSTVPRSGFLQQFRGGSGGALHFREISS